LRRLTPAADRLIVNAAELLFRNIAVMALQLLLGAQLLAVVRQLALAALAVLAGTVLTAIDRRLGPAPDIFAQPAVELVFCGLAFAHRIPFQIMNARHVAFRAKETRPPLPPISEA